MEKNATKGRSKYIEICPLMAATTSMRPSSSTRRLVKILSALLGVPIIRRGKANLDEIAYYVYKAKLRGFFVVLSRHNQPSRIDVYREINGYFKHLGYITLEYHKIYSKPPICVGCKLILEQQSNSLLDNLARFIEIIRNDTCEKFGGILSTCKISDGGDIEFQVKGRTILKLKLRHAIFLLQ